MLGCPMEVVLTCSVRCERPIRRLKCSCSQRRSIAISSQPHTTSVLRTSSSLQRSSRFCCLDSVLLSPSTITTRSIEYVLSSWERRYKLTSSESEVLRLAIRHDREEISVLRSVAPTTIKKQIASILQRTGDATLDRAIARLFREALALQLDPQERVSDLQRGLVHLLKPRNQMRLWVQDRIVLLLLP